MRRLIAALVALWLLSNPAHAGVYLLIDGATATQTAPTTGSNRIVTPKLEAAGGPLPNQAFVVWTSATACTVQILGSNDGVTWVAYGSTIAASATAGGSSNRAASAAGTTPFAFFAAIVTVFTGTGACWASVSG